MGRTPKKPKGQLPSKNVRVQVYLGTDDNGKRRYKSFTAPTRKKALEMANVWKVTHKDEQTEPLVENISVKEAVRRYIDIKSGALSPSTVAGYEKDLRNYLSGNLGHKELDSIQSTDIQIWVSELSKSLSPKSIRNVYGLLSASLEMFAPNMHINVTLPAKKKPELYCPNSDNIKQLLQSITNTELEIAVLLAAFGPLRRGEICALTSDDIHGNTVRVSKSMVKGPEGDWHVKQPKTYNSYRDVEFPGFVISKISGKRGRIVQATPDQISNRFKKAILKANLPHFRFHDLRHYSASIMHAIGVPDQYILQRGGWASDNVMKSVYRNAISSEATRQNKKINKYFQKLV